MHRIALSLALAVAPLAAIAADQTPAGPPNTQVAAPAKRHPLRGVITRVDTENSTLMVKHEAIPGVMRAMTMMFKVDPSTPKSVKPGDAITALMSREPDGWWLHDVKPAEPKSK